MCFQTTKRSYVFNLNKLLYKEKRKEVQNSSKSPRNKTKTQTPNESRVHNGNEDILKKSNKAVAAQSSQSKNEVWTRKTQ